MRIGKKYTRERRTLRVVISIVDQNRQKEIEPRGCKWPDGVKFEDAEHVERPVIQRVVPHTPERQSFLGNSSLLCTQSSKF